LRPYLQWLSWIAIFASICSRWHLPYRTVHVGTTAQMFTAETTGLLCRFVEQRAKLHNSHTHMNDILQDIICSVDFLRMWFGKQNVRKLLIVMRSTEAREYQISPTTISCQCPNNNHTQSYHCTYLVFHLQTLFNCIASDLEGMTSRSQLRDRQTAHQHLPEKDNHYQCFPTISTQQIELCNNIGYVL
jgi:hypothetical protein